MLQRIAHKFWTLGVLFVDNRAIDRSTPQIATAEDGKGQSVGVPLNRSNNRTQFTGGGGDCNSSPYKWHLLTLSAFLCPHKGTMRLQVLFAYGASFVSFNAAGGAFVFGEQAGLLEQRTFLEWYKKMVKGVSVHRRKSEEGSE
ncbi:MAG: hypothetical protein IT427_06265 [Pirellulales bacterium]|nr:hypothetical protein [Pirellulales bacterium]